MNTLKRFISTVPIWAYLFVLTTIFVNTVFFIYYIRHTPAGTSVFLWSMYLVMILFSFGSLSLLGTLEQYHC